MLVRWTVVSVARFNASHLRCHSRRGPLGPREGNPMALQCPDMTPAARRLQRHWVPFPRLALANLAGDDILMFLMLPDHQSGTLDRVDASQLDASRCAASTLMSLAKEACTYRQAIEQLDRIVNLCSLKPNRRPIANAYRSPRRATRLGAQTKTNLTTVCHTASLLTLLPNRF